MNNQKINVYTTERCPRCHILKTKLSSAGIKYAEVSDVDLMISKGIMSVPVLEVDGETMDFSTANKWINERGLSI